jgi:hypothetical protein
MQASRLKQIMFGTLLSDASIDAASQRYDISQVQHEYIDYLYDALSGLTHTSFSRSAGRLSSRRSRYMTKMRKLFYPHGRKAVTEYVAKRLGPEAWAHVWMCDGYLEAAKNRRKNKVQNVGWLCLESFPPEELELLQQNLRKHGIETSLAPRPWGYGYRIRIGGENLQRFISMVYEYVLPCFAYKTILFYKKRKSALELPSAEHYIVEYDTVEDVVRHREQSRQT